jgi:RNA polymerase sigma-70 factor (ECF subfamily)
LITEHEQLLLRRAQGGDEAAFEEIVRANEAVVYNLALRALGNREDAEDAAQEVFLRAFRSLKHFRGESSIRVWLCSVARTVCIDALRRRRGSERLTAEDADGNETELEIPDERFDPAVIAERKDRREQLAAALNLLPQEQREALLLCAVADLSYAEIAGMLSVDLGTVKSRIFRARKKLCAILSRDGNFSAAPASKEAEEGERA